MPIVDISTRAGEARAVVHDVKEYIQGACWNKGMFYETRLLEYIYWHFKGRVFVDVGSNIGNHTLHFAKFCSPSHVISIEPVAEAMVIQKEVLALNGLKNVTFHECAASNYNGRGAMIGWEKNPSYYLTCGQLHDGDEVDVRTLDTLLADVKGINVLKIDVETKESQVLEGAVGILDEHKPALFVEFRKKPDYAWCKEFLRQFGYRQVGSHFQEGQVFEFTVHADETEVSGR